MKFRRYLQGLGDGEWSRQSLAYDELKQLVLRIANEHDGGIPPLRAPRIAGSRGQRASVAQAAFPSRRPSRRRSYRGDRRVACPPAYLRLILSGLVDAV